MKGKAWKYGDNIDTDVIIPARYLTSAAPEVLKAHCLEDLDQSFAGRVSPGDFIVAGSNFGCGSSREHAPIAIKAAGVSAVIARSFARIFFRNSFNIGLPILESPAAVDNIDSGDELEVDLAAGTIKNLTKGKEFMAAPIPEFMRQLIADGGLLPHVQKLIASGELKPAAPAKTEEAPAEARPRGSRMLQIEKEKPAAGLTAPWVEDEPAQKPAPANGEEDDEDEEEGGEGSGA